VRGTPVEGGTVELAIADSGEGMTEEQQRQLFQPFNRLGREVGAIEGTGIGLVITQRLLALMDSQLQVDSAPDKGSTFSFLLPVSSANQ
jgi:signal transduction histidine kinase